MEIMFRQQVSQEVVHALVQDKGLAKYEATLLAMDIRNFTSFAENHTPGDIMDFQQDIRTDTGYCKRIRRRGKPDHGRWVDGYF